MAQHNAIWLPDALASERPASPGKGRYLYRATDTGAVSYWDGSAWRTVYDPTATVNATQLQGRSVASDAPTNGQALVWDAAQSRWEPGTVAGGGLVLTTSHTWTLRQGSGTAAESAGQVTLSGAISTALTGASRPAAYAALPDGRTLAISVRLVSVTGDSNTYAGFCLQKSGGTAENALLFQVQPSGAGQWGYESGGGYTSYATVIPGSLPVGGTAWLRVEVDRAGRARFLYGIGSGSTPPSFGEWQQLGDHALTGWSGVGAVDFDRVFFYLSQTSTGAATQAVFANLTIETLSES